MSISIRLFNYKTEEENRFKIILILFMYYESFFYKITTYSK
jgi:hypothetical protein